MKLSREQQKILAKMALATQPQELTCEEWLDRVGRYVEIVVAGKPVPPELSPVEEHLALCPECSEEFEALRRALSD